ncbi:hypothetical protein HK104_009267 [Borealophlyctis nickersoniae]|nr:hypothetical protein HK104_009267 [Borealophlyctis nickersoniae]
MAVFNFEHQFVQYGQYHNNTINKAIHVIFVPTILFTFLVWITQTGEFAQWAYSDILPLNGAFFFIATYLCYYIVLEPMAGLLYVPALLAMCSYANTFARSQHFGMNPQPAATLIHIASWIMQFIGHGAAEGRAPALLDNLLQAVVLAPFFVWCEVLFSLGYRPNLQKRLHSQIVRAIQEWKSGKGATVRAKKSS